MVRDSSRRGLATMQARVTWPGGGDVEPVAGEEELQAARQDLGRDALRLLERRRHVAAEAPGSTKNAEGAALTSVSFQAR